MILVTGKITSGKTSFLETILKTVEKQWSVAGFISRSSPRKHGTGLPADNYNIEIINKKTIFSWARRFKGQHGFEFNDKNRQLVEDELLQQIKQSSPEIIILDNLGTLELADNGFHNLFKNIITGTAGKAETIIASVKKSAIDKFIKKYNLENVKIIDLDETTQKEGKNKVIRILKILDGDKIGLYSTMAGLTEISIGSTLRTLRVPFKGAFLAYLQNIMMILFGKNLRGRGLFWIAAITSGLKSFSPSGGKLRPMLYILVQGGIFSLPIKIFGWNIVSVFTGSLLMGWSTVFLSTSIKYIIYGSSVIEAYVNTFNKLISFLGLPPLTFFQLIVLSMITKGIISALIAVVVYHLNFSKYLEKLELKIKRVNTNNNKTELPSPASFKKSLSLSFRDLLSKQYIISFIFVSLLIYFFTKVSSSGFAIILIRGLILSWFGFLLARRMNFTAIVSFLRRKKLDHVADSMINAINTINSLRGEDKDETKLRNRNN